MPVVATSFAALYCFRAWARLSFEPLSTQKQLQADQMPTTVLVLTPGRTACDQGYYHPPNPTPRLAQGRPCTDLYVTLHGRLYDRHSNMQHGFSNTAEAQQHGTNVSYQGSRCLQRSTELCRQGLMMVAATDSVAGHACRGPP